MPAENEIETILILAELEEVRETERALFAGALYGAPGDTTMETLSDLETALTQNEEALHQTFVKHPYLLKYTMEGSGHHGTWAFSKQMIRPQGADGTSGLIPDFLVATRSSLGYQWTIVELKRADVQFSNASGDAYSPTGNRAIAQCSEYLRHFQDYIGAIRSNIRVQEVIPPGKAIILIGDSDAETEDQKRCRGNFVRNNNRIDVISYRRIVGSVRADLAAFNRDGSRTGAQ